MTLRSVTLKCPTGGDVSKDVVQLGRTWLAKVACGRQADCYLKSVALKATDEHRFGVKRTHPDELRDVLAKNLRLARSRLGISQEDLALMSGVHRSYLSDIERSQRNISIDNLSRLAKALEVDAWELLRPVVAEN